MTSRLGTGKLDNLFLQCIHMTYLAAFPVEITVGGRGGEELVVVVLLHPRVGPVEQHHQPCPGETLHHKIRMLGWQYIIRNACTVEITKYLHM